MMNNQLAIRDEMPLSELGTHLVKSGFFADTREASQAIVKVLAGRELGFGPVASMTGIYVIQGRISLSANLLGAAIKRSGRYNFKVKEISEKVCSIEFFENGASVGVSTFTAEDARKAGTKNMEKFARNMLYARAMSNGARWYCPDVFGGPVYTPEELGANVNEEGEVIDVPVTVSGNGHKLTPSEEFEAHIEEEQSWAENGRPPMTLEEAMKITNKEGKAYGDLTTEQLRGMKKSIAKIAEPTDEHLNKTMAIDLILTARSKSE